MATAPPCAYAKCNDSPHAWLSAADTASCTSGFCTALKANEFSAGNSMINVSLPASYTAFVLRNSTP